MADKWIQGAIKNPGALREKLGVEKEREDSQGRDRLEDLRPQAAG